MPHLFFDYRDGERLVADDTGIDFETMEQAMQEAARSLAELAKEVIPGSVRRTLSIEVREKHRALFLARIIFEIVPAVSSNRA